MDQINDDTRARDHLANERTYLAWLRTGISMMGFGIVIARLRYLIPGEMLTVSSGMVHASNIGLVFTVAGLLTVIVSVWRFLAVQNQLRRGAYRSSRWLALIVTGVVICFGVMILWYLADARHPI